MRSFVIAATCAAVAAFAAGCSGGGGDKTPTPSPQPTRPASPVTTPPPKQTPSVDIREVDLESQPAVQSALEDSGGQYVQTDVIYADLTNDGFDDAIVPISSGGTLGNLGFVVFTMNGTQPVDLLSEFPGESGGVALAVENDKLVTTQPVPGPDDPECCPSFLRRTVYAWNGNALAVEGVTTEPNPAAGGAKLTPAAGQ